MQKIIKYNLCSMLVILLAHHINSSGSDGLKVVRLDGPKYIRKGEDLNLYCDYDIDTKSVYVVKWYHEGTQEFYRFLPKESPSQQVFLKRGIYVNETASNEHRVVLTNTSNETSGKFKCVVSGDAETNFKTLENEHEVSIISIGYERPKLVVDQTEYSQGDTIRANCSVDKSSHPLIFSWFINDIQIPSSKSMTFHLGESGILSEFVSSLSTELPESSSRVVLKCRGELFSLYSMSTERVIQIKPRRLSMMSTSSVNAYSNNSQAKNFAQSFLQNLQYFHCFWTLLILIFSTSFQLVTLI